MPSLLERIKSTTTLKDGVKKLSESSIYDKVDLINTHIPILNIALSGDIDGGFGPGLCSIAGPSKHFKSLICLLAVKAFLEAKPKGVCIFYDSEFGIPAAYLDSIGIDGERVLHVPIANIEDLKFDLMQQITNINASDDVIIFVDSIGNLASKKEVDDALEQKAVADMTRAKQLKSLFRMVTPYLTIKKIPMFVVNHTYESQGMFPTKIMSGGTGPGYSSNTILFMGRQQNKTSQGIEGYDFMIGVEKSRLVREKTKVPLTVSYEGGISKWSGLLEIALVTGHVIKPTNGFYTRPLIEGDKKWRAAATNCPEFWKPIFEQTNFKEAVSDLYKVGSKRMIDFDEELEAKENDDE